MEENDASSLHLQKRRKHEDEEEETEDRLSGLSDELIHLIMSFLSLQEAVRTCVLSKKWKFRWRSLPYLHFDLATYSFKHGTTDFDTTHSNIAAKLSSFNNFISQFLVRRRPTNLVKLRFNSKGNYYGPEYRVDSSLVELVICYALQHNVQELDIRACCHKCIQFPSCFPSCELLTTLKLECVESGEAAAAMDSSSDEEEEEEEYSDDDDDYGYSYNIKKLLFPALQTLHLVRFSVRDPDFYSRIFSTSPNLQNLKFVDTFFDKIDSLSICAPNLKSLEFKFPYAYNKPAFYTPEFKVIVDAPKLTSFKFDGYVNPIWCFPCNLSSLDEVCFALSWRYFVRGPGATKPDFLDLLNTFKKFTDVKYLTLSSHMIKAFSGLPALVEESQLQFPNLKYLKLLVGGDSDFFVPPSLLFRFISNFTLLKICSRQGY